MRCFTGIVFGLLMACAPAPGQVVRDSAGVLVANNRSAVWTERDRWRLSEKPLVEIGAEGDPMHELESVTAALGLSGGRIAIASMKTDQFRIFDSTGTFVSLVGRPGRGPGEFVGLYRAGVLDGDSLVGYSVRDRRINVFRPDGRPARSFNLLSRSGELTMPEGWFGDGGIVASVRIPVPHKDLGRITDSARLRILNGVGETKFEVRTIPVGERVERGRSSSSVVFGREAAMAVRGKRLYVGGWDQFEVLQFDRSGRLNQIMRRPHTSPPVTRADMDRMTAGASSDGPGGRTGPPRGLQYTFATSFAPVGTVLADAVGAVWVESLDANSFRVRRGGPGIPTTGVPVQWTVFDSTGLWLGEVAMPARFTPTHIGDTWIVGLYRDDDLVEYVRKYRLTKPR